ncbi:MAG: hypothetical protein IT338_14830 [Thermomicrobiales bacterium]|nr:hypothetical protein [Thermomicrobiales bacterium]
MSEQEILNGLIATYRELNLKVRPLPEERLNLGRGRDTVRHVILDMRNDELRFSQALKDRLSGGGMVDVLANGREEGPEVAPAGNTTVEVISQFGTARESTLAMLRGMAPEAWDEPGGGGITIRNAVTALLANDGKHMEKIVALLGSPSPN